MNRIVLKNPHQEKRIINQRTIIACAVILLLLFFLILRLAYLQLFKHDYYTSLAEKNRIEIVPIEPVRGLIYDRNGVLLARNIPVFSLEITPALTKNLKETVQSLTSLLSIPEKEVRLFYKNMHQQARFKNTPLILKLTEKDMAIFSLNRHRFPGVEIKAHLLRDYPFADKMAHPLGYVGRINAATLEKLDLHQYRASDYIGKTGLEASYEEALHGDIGSKEIEIDARGNIIRTLSVTPPSSGKTLHLTLDANLQEKALAAFGKTQGTLVALDPNNGDVLAMVSNPSFDPSVFVQGILQADYNALIQDPKHPLYNRAIYGLYPPGSAVKPFIGVTALGEQIVTPNERIFDPGYFILKNSKHVFHDWNHQGHGWVNMHRAIVVSCDTYFYWLSLKMRIQGINQALKAFGFGSTTGIDLLHEPTGLVPSPAWKEKHDGQSWFPGDTLNTSIGQGFMQVNALQLAVATATLALHGETYQPHLLKAIEDSETGETQAFAPIKRPPLVFSDNKAYDDIIEAMQDVIRSPEGRGFRFGRSAPYSVAAKTGTAQVYSIKDNDAASSSEGLRDHGLFIAFAPAEQAKIVVVVITEHSTEAPSIARKVMDAYLINKSHS